MARDDLEETLKAVASLFDDFVGEAVGEDLRRVSFQYPGTLMGPRSPRL